MAACILLMCFKYQGFSLRLITGIEVTVGKKNRTVVTTFHSFTCALLYMIFGGEHFSCQQNGRFQVPVSTR